MGRATFDNFPDKFLNITFPNVVEPFPWDVTRDGEDITFTLGEGENEKSEVHKTTDVRKFLIENFNWNGIVHFMHMLSDKNDDFTYTRPTDLKGIPEDDDLLIIPDEATEAIVYEQAKYAIETKYSEAPENNIDKILKYVDGKAKTGFSTDVLETTYNDLVKESDNTEMSYEGSSFTMPDLETVSESDLYDFLKNLALSRNGLWIDEDNRTNFVSIRRDLDTGDQVKYNDTLFLVWKEGGTKKALQYIGSTEPGNLTDGQLLPQTTTMFLGLHISSSSGTPAGRTIYAYRKGNGNNNHYFQGKDTTMNIHYANHQMKGLLTDYGIHNNKENPGYDDSELDAYLVLVRAFRILTQWGAGKESKTSAYQNLENNTKKLIVGEVTGSTVADKKVDILRDQEDVVKTINYSIYSSFIDKNYKATGNKTKDTIRKDRAIKLLMNYHNRQNDGTPNDCYTGYELKNLLEELKKDKIFKSIVETQLEYELNLKKVDAQPGGGAIKKIEWSESQKQQVKKQFDDQKNKAKEDWDLMSKVFEDWNSNEILKDKVIDEDDDEISIEDHFKTNIKIKEIDYKDKDTKEIDNFGGDEIKSYQVNTWSEGCQVIYGGQHFYEFLYKLTQFVKDSNQERWYYSLVDSSTIGDNTNSEEIGQNSEQSTPNNLRQ